MSGLNDHYTVCRNCHESHFSFRNVCPYCGFKRSETDNAVSSVIGVILILTMMFSFLPVAYLSMDALATSFENMIETLCAKIDNIDIKIPDNNATGNDPEMSTPPPTIDTHNETITITVVCENATGIPYFVVYTQPYFRAIEVDPP